MPIEGSTGAIESGGTFLLLRGVLAQVGLDTGVRGYPSKDYLGDVALAELRHQVVVLRA